MFNNISNMDLNLIIAFIGLLIVVMTSVLHVGIKMGKMENKISHNENDISRLTELIDKLTTDVNKVFNNITAIKTKLEQ